MKVWMGEELERIRWTEATLVGFAQRWGYSEIRLPNVWGLDTFSGGEDKLSKTMYTFQDKGNRDMCLVPEATAVIRELYNSGWDKSMKKPVRLFYLQRCYRYDKPQEGRYREFTQFGVEVLGMENAYEEVTALLHDMLLGRSQFLEFKGQPERGLHYYSGRTFEVECPLLGAQKQVIGGGEYAEGAGFGIGVERLAMAEHAYRLKKFGKTT